MNLAYFLKIGFMGPIFILGTGHPKSQDRSTQNIILCISSNFTSCVCLSFQHDCRTIERMPTYAKQTLCSECNLVAYLISKIKTNSDIQNYYYYQIWEYINSNNYSNFHQDSNPS